MLNVLYIFFANEEGGGEIKGSIRVLLVLELNESMYVTAPVWNQLSEPD